MIPNQVAANPEGVIENFFCCFHTTNYRTTCCCGTISLANAVRIFAVFDSLSILYGAVIMFGAFSAADFTTYYLP